MNTFLKVVVLMILSGSACAGDLVLKLGTTGNFRYHRIPVTGTVTVSPSTGDITVDPVAETGSSNDGWCPTTGGGGSAPTFTTALTPSTTALAAGGGSVTLTWAVSNATNGCVASSAGVTGWNGNAVTSPTTVNLTTAGSYPFTVSCSNAFGSTNSGPVTVTVAESGGSGNPECDTRPATAGLTRQTAMTNYNLGGTLNQQNSEFGIGTSINVTGYSPLFGTTFNQANQVARVFIDTGKYVAMGFSTTGVATGATGKISWAQASQAIFSVQISPCVGDFQFVTDPMCKASAVETGGIAWKIGTKPPTNPGFYCYLTPGKTYYINSVATDDGTWTTTTCTTAWCDWFVNYVGGV
jgi:hypothetical protein